ncbi:hypothetical protein [Chitinophaga qingshengii]|uniref:DUF2282 domain-containing protein n=1 Tax=Chitinophaga qingshengii TaxID=1569794 RepID=A0ABR7TMQ1_9BACT|nr:hypothetical protein [Chitinophaga qingshengii]MBC9931760.1 hypothetical protein [Chitinophaga qingshengii]
MKKVKVLLSAVAVIAVIAGAVATQARQDLQIFVPVDQNKPLDGCVVTQNASAITSVGGTLQYATLSPGACPTVQTRVITFNHN